MENNIIELERENENANLQKLADEENTVETKEAFDPNTYKIMIDMIKEMNDQYNMLKEMTEENVKNMHFKSDIIEAIIPISKEKITEMTYEEKYKFLEEYVIYPYTIEKIMSEQMGEIKSVDYQLDYIMNSIKDASMNLYTAKLEADKLKSESQDVLNEYFNYISSNKVQENRKKRLEMMKNSLADYNEDDVKKAKMKRMIDSMEASMSLSFLFTRLNTLKEKEVKSIKDAFFDEKRGKYIMSKYTEKIGKFGFDPKLYRYFFNIEENFLDEKYHVFNNLFLFIYMRFVAYSNPYDKTDKLFVQSLTGSMANLIYHKFVSTENEIIFIDTVKKLLDYFEEYRDYFDKNNTTHPNHEIRKKADIKHEENRKSMLIDKMNSLNITGYDATKSANELQEYLNNSLDEMIRSQQKNKTSDDIAITESEDGVVTIKPLVEETKISESNEPLPEIVNDENNEIVEEKEYIPDNLNNI